MRNMNDLVRQAGVMQNKIAKMQQEMAERTVEASSGGGMVKVVATCKQDIVSITIDPKALEGGDVEMLQDLVLTAVNEAVRIGRATMDREVSAITGGIKLPASFKDIGKGGGGTFLKKGFLLTLPTSPPSQGFCVFGTGRGEGHAFCPRWLPVARRPTVDGGLSRP